MIRRYWIGCIAATVVFGLLALSLPFLTFWVDSQEFFFKPPTQKVLRVLNGAATLAAIGSCFFALMLPTHPYFKDGE